MRTITLSEVSESIQYGVTASASSQPIGPKFLRITDIQNGAVDWASVPFCDVTERKLASCRLKPGDIVFARTGATAGKSFLIRSCPEPTVFASYLIRVRPSSQVVPAYLAHFFRSPEYWDQIFLKTSGAAQPGVSFSKLRELQVPLPPIAEQRHIAAILDKADKLRRIRYLFLDRLNVLRDAIFVDMFGSFRNSSEGWPVRSLDEIVRETKLGLVRSAAGLGEDLPFRYIRMNAISRGGDLNLSDVARTTATQAEVGDYRLKTGDFLLNTRNSYDLVGKSAVFNGPGVYLFNNNIMRIRFRPIVSSEYVAAVFQRPLIQNSINARKAGATSVFAVYWKTLRTVQIPLPPAALQLAFASRVAELDKLKSTQRVHLAKLDALYTSLRNRTFRGDLTSGGLARDVEIA